MAEARHVKGSPHTMELAAPADLVAGQIVVLGDVVMIHTTRTEITNTPTGTLAAFAAGGGTYESVIDGAASVGDKLYWDDTANKLTKTATGNKVAGTALIASAADGDVMRWFHRPDA